MSLDLMAKLAKKKQSQQQAFGEVDPPDVVTEAVAVVAPEPAPDAQLPLLVNAGEGNHGKQVLAEVQSSKRSEGKVAAVNDALSFPPSDADMVEHYRKELDRKTLYVGCMPVNQHATMLEVWLAPLMASAAQSLGVAHYGMAEYGKGKPALAALVAHKASVEGVPQVMVADPRLPSTDAALEVLRPLFDHVVVRFG